MKINNESTLCVKKYIRIIYDCVLNIFLFMLGKIRCIKIHNPLQR